MNLDKQQLEIKVNKLASDLGCIKLNNMLAGGVVSDVYSAVLTLSNGDFKNVVVKYTKEEIPPSELFSKVDVQESFSQTRLVQNLDVSIQNELNVPVPKILKHFEQDSITIMDNFTESGFELLQSCLLEKKVSKKLAEELGLTLAVVRNDLEKSGSKFHQLESTQSQFEERFLELKVLLYNGRMDVFNEIEENFISNSGDNIIWTDGDQKNFAITQDGKVMVFDLGRSIKCDPDFMLPNLLGHLGLFIIAGYLDNGVAFLKNCQESFEKKYSEFNSMYVIDEKKFVNYFTASLLHRGMAMRWIDPKISDIIGEDSLKYASMHFGDLIFDKHNRIVTIDKMLVLLQEVAILASAGEYRRKEIKFSGI